MPPKGGTAPVSSESTRISPKKTWSTTPGRSVAQEPHEGEASVPPDSPPTNMRHHCHEAAIVVSSKLTVTRSEDEGEKYPESGSAMGTAGTRERGGERGGGRAGGCADGDGWKP